MWNHEPPTGWTAYDCEVFLMRLFKYDACERCGRGDIHHIVRATAGLPDMPSVVCVVPAGIPTLAPLRPNANAHRKGEEVRDEPPPPDVS